MIVLFAKLAHLVGHLAHNIDIHNSNKDIQMEPIKVQRLSKKVAVSIVQGMEQWSSTERGTATARFSVYELVYRIA